MKRIIVSGLLVAMASVCRAAVITWDGEANDGLWSNPVNWSGNILPGQDDVVILDNSQSGGSYTVVLPVTSTIVQAIRISPAQSNVIILVLPPANSLTTDAFITTGTGYVIQIDRGGRFVNHATVTSGTNLTISDSIRINNGGCYIHRTRSGHSSWVTRLARIEGTEKGVFEFDVPVASFTVSLSGRYYGDLVFSTLMHNGPVTYSGTGAQHANIRGDLHLNGQAQVSLGFTTGQFIIHGNLHQEAATVFNLQTSVNNNFIHVKGNVQCHGTISKTGSGIPELVLNGEDEQKVTIANLSGFVMLNINNGDDVRLEGPLTIPYVLRLTNGKVHTNSSSLLTIADNAVIIGGSVDRFVTGPLRKVGNESFMYPVGKGLRYAPIALSAGAESSDDFVVEYKAGNPQAEYSPIFESPVTHMSALEWWDVERRSGTGARDVTLFVTAYSEATLLEHLRVLRFDGTIWKNEGNTAFFGLSVGPITSQPVSQFNPAGKATPFTLGSTSSSENPLPVELVSFNAIRQTRRSAKILWEMADYPEEVLMFDVQRDAGFGFESIGTVMANSVTTTYSLVDPALMPGANYYRLRVISLGMDVVISKTVTIYNESLLTRLRTNISGNSLNLVVTASKREQVRIVVVDNLGRTVLIRDEQLNHGENLLRYQLPWLAPGVYHVSVISADGEKVGERVII